MLVTHDRSRTVVGHRPPLASRLAPELPAGVRNLTSGNPDPQLLPELGPALAAVAPVRRLYGDEPGLDALLELARTTFAADGLEPEELAIVAGAPVVTLTRARRLADDLVEVLDYRLGTRRG